MEFIKRFFFPLKRSRALDHLPSFASIHEIGTKTRYSRGTYSEIHSRILRILAKEIVYCKGKVSLECCFSFSFIVFFSYSRLLYIANIAFDNVFVIELIKTIIFFYLMCKFIDDLKLIKRKKRAFRELLIIV